ncbi:MAG: transglutaminase-like domain-containing protein [Actinomycetota bacterium]
MVDPTLGFVELVNSPSRHVDLARGALLLAAHADSELDVDEQVGRLDELAAQCPEPTLDGLRRMLFQDLGFSGDRDDYYRPDNSLLDRVLDRRQGLPISLSLLMIDLGRRLGVPLDGVGMPGHFLVRDRVLQDVFVDPFGGGRILTVGDCERIFRSLAGEGARFDPAFLEPVSDTSILARMAANLVNAYQRLDDRRGLRWAARLRVRCPGVAPGELAHLGDLLAHTGAWDEAADALDAAAEVEADERLTRRAHVHRSRLN